jgi:N-acetylmuramoyl-L-alanine amidase
MSCRGAKSSGRGSWLELAAESPLGGFAAAGESSACSGEGGISVLQQKLRSYGYPIDVTGQLDKQTETVVKAFQRHFRPQRVDGLADRSTIATLDRLFLK